VSSNVKSSFASSGLRQKGGRPRVDNVPTHSPQRIRRHDQCGVDSREHPFEQKDIDVSKLCTRCGHPLPSPRLFRNTCRNCGAEFTATRRLGFSVASFVYGALAIPLMVVALLLPFPIWFNLGVIPLLYILGGVALSVIQQEWREV